MIFNQKLKRIEMKATIKIILIYLVTSILLSPIRSFGKIGITISTIVGFAVYFLLTTIFIKKGLFKASPIIVLVAGLIGMSITNLPFHIIHFRDTIFVFVEYIVHFGAVIAGFYYMRIEKPNNRIIFTIICAIIVLVATFYVNDLVVSAVRK